MTNEIDTILNKLIDTNDKSELAMRLAYVITTRDKYLMDPETKYNIEEVIDPISRKRKTRITIEVEGNTI